MKPACEHKYQGVGGSTGRPFCFDCGDYTDGKEPKQMQSYIPDPVPEHVGVPGHVTTYDPVNKPKHYNDHPSGVECITITEHFCFNLGNVIKYIWRADLKNDAMEDLKKAAWYLNREIEKRSKNG